MVDLRTRHISVIAINAVSVAAMATETPLANLQIILTAIAGLGGADWVAQRFKDATAPKKAVA